MNPYILLIGAFALWYIPGALALVKMEYTLKGLQLRSIKEKTIELFVSLEVKNVTSTNLKIKSLSVSVFLDNNYITELLTQNVVLSGNSTEIVGALLILNKNEIPEALWNSFLNNSLKNSILTFKGIARANGRPYPFITSMTVGDLIEYNF